MEPENLKAINQSFEIQAGQFENKALQFTKQEYLDYTVNSVKPCGEETMLEVAAGTCVCGRSFATKMKHKVKVTVLDKKLYPELQQQYCADPNSGVCACYNVGDEFMFYRDDKRDDYWHMGAGTLIKSGQPDEGMLISPGTMHCGEEGVPFCSEAWDAISRYIYTGLQGGAIMHGWTNDDRVMITCCNDGTRPVIFKIERIDYE